MSSILRPPVLFHLSGPGGWFSGGHLKVWDYFTHVRHSTHLRPLVYFGNGLSPARVPWWQPHPEEITDTYRPAEAGALFFKSRGD